MCDHPGPSRSIMLHPSSQAVREMVREGVLPHQGPIHTQFASEAVRLSTYQDWPPGLKQKKEQMAAAGLFYIGRSDQASLWYYRN